MILLKKGKKHYPWLENYPEMVNWHEEIAPKAVYHFLDKAAQSFPDRTCLRFFGKGTTYKELQTLVNCAAKGLQGIGVKKGTRVGLYLPNSPQFVIFYYAILKAGGVVVNYNPLYAFREIKHQMEDSGTSILITLNFKELFTKAKNLLNSTLLEKIIITDLETYLPFPKNILFPWLKRNELAEIAYGRAIIHASELFKNNGDVYSDAIDPEKDLAVIQYTGGTTGVPKGAMLTHANVYTNAVQSRGWFSNLEDGKEVFIAVLPFFHVFAMTAIMNLSIHIGAEIVLHPKFVLKDVLKDIQQLKVTVLVGVPTLFNAILHSSLTKKYSLQSLKASVSGGAPLPKEIKTKFEQISGSSLVEGYGLTEASPVVCANPLQFHGIETPVQEADQKNIAAKIGAVGLPLPRTVVTIRDQENTKKILPIGEIGELCVEGPQVMLGYYNKPEETAQVLVDGILRTGDLAFMDKKGFTYIVDRSKEVIISAGFNVYPRNVEESLYQFPGVEEAAVIGVPDSHRGQRVEAYIKLKPGHHVEPKELTSFLKGHLAHFEIPSKYHFVDALPKTMVGKISKKDIVREGEE